MQEDHVPGFTADPKLQAKLDNLDSHLEPKEDAKKDEKPAVKEEEKPKTEAPDKQANKEADPKKGAVAEDTAEGGEGDGEGDGAGEAPEDEGYTIDEGEEDEEKPDAEADKPSVDQSQLSAEQKYILDNVSPIKVRGTVGDSTKVQEFDVLAPEQLPSGFKFADDVEMAKATKSFNMLEQRAAQLQQDYRNQETQKAAKEFKAREDLADRQDIAKLQKDGTLPKFKAQPNSADFEKDAGVQLVQEVLDFKEKQNQRYMDEYNAGRPYKHIGFEEAWAMFKRDNPTKADLKLQKEDKEREALAKRTSRSPANNGEESAQKARVHSGMSSRDLDHLIENLDW